MLYFQILRDAKHRGGFGECRAALGFGSDEVKKFLPRLDTAKNLLHNLVSLLLTQFGWQAGRNVRRGSGAVRSEAGQMLFNN